MAEMKKHKKRHEGGVSRSHGQHKTDRREHERAATQRRSSSRNRQYPIVETRHVKDRRHRTRLTYKGSAVIFCAEREHEMIDTKQRTKRDFVEASEQGVKEAPENTRRQAGECVRRNSQVEGPKKHSSVLQKGVGLGADFQSAELLRP